VVRETVALDDKPAVDEEIHSADAVDSHLQFHVASQTAQHEADEGLGTRLRTLVEKRPQGSVAPGKVREDVSETVFIHCPEMPRAVESRDRIPRPLAAHRCTECFADRYEHIIGGAGGGTPMSDDLRRRPRSRRAGGVRSELDVQPRTLPYEHAEKSQQ
jgi:hypothetical protein